MLKRITALMSMLGLLASLFVVQATAFAGSTAPDYLIWLDSAENVRWDVTSLLGSESVPVGGLQSEYLFIGSDEEFHGVELTMDNGSSDGEFQFSYYPGGNGPFLIPDGDVEFSSLEGTVTATWDVDEMADWKTMAIVDGDYATQEAAFAVIQDKYWVLLETTTPASGGEVLTASDITLITEAATSTTTTTTTTSTTSTDETTEVTTTTTTSELSHNGELSFSDVPRGEAATPKIEFLVADGVLKGYDTGEFRPDNTINRAELMKVLVYGQGIYPTADQYDAECLSDIPAGEWYEAPICYAVKQGWVKGYDDGTFRPSQTVNRAEAAKMIVNSMRFGDPENVMAHYITMLPDVNDGDWFAGYVATLSSAIVVPNSEAYNPGEGMTREAAASFIFNVRALQETNEEYYSTDVREEFLELYGMEALIDLAYTESTSSSSSSSTPSYNVSFTVHGSCSNPSLALSNYSDMEVDFSDWYVSSSSSGKVYPFAGVVLADGGSKTVTASGEFGVDGVTSPSIYIYTPEGTSKSSSSCSNS